MKAITIILLLDYQSAISAYHEPIKGVSVGKTPRVLDLLTGIFITRLTQPRFTFTWDVRKSYQFSIIKKPTLKETMLLALTSTTRASNICFLDIRYLIEHSCAYIFDFGKNTKTSKKSKSRKLIKHYPFNGNKNSCVCHHTDLYLDKLKEWHTEEAHFLCASSAFKF